MRQHSGNDPAIVLGLWWGTDNELYVLVWCVGAWFAIKSPGRFAIYTVAALFVTAHVIMADTRVPFATKPLGVAMCVLSKSPRVIDAP